MPDRATETSPHDPQDDIPGHPPRPAFASNPLAAVVEKASAKLAEAPRAEEGAPSTA
jgi:hypothetical protein